MEDNYTLKKIIAKMQSMVFINFCCIYAVFDTLNG